MVKKTDTPPFESFLRYCKRCCMPESERGTSLDDLCICRACRSSEEKMHINWNDRRDQLARIFQNAKANAQSAYDCMVPISGGKDSTYQLYVLREEFQLKTLAVTFNQNWQSESGFYNLFNSLRRFNCDHLMFTPNRDLVDRMAAKSLETMGDPCWHCHSGLAVFPITIAIMFGVPLMIYGEPSSEQGLGSYKEPMEIDLEYTFKTSLTKRNEDMVGATITHRDLSAFVFPSGQQYKAARLHKLLLGSYQFWDDERQTEFVRDEFAWKETEMEPSYKRYKCVECVYPGMHDFTCYMKRGFGRATFQACADVRNGLLTREEGFALVNAYDRRKPEVLDYYLESSGMTMKRFEEIMRQHRKEIIGQENELPVTTRTAANEELLIPLPQQLIKKYRGTIQAARVSAQTPLPELCPGCHLPLDAAACSACGEAGTSKMLESILQERRENAGDNYDCVVPLTGSLSCYHMLHVLVRVHGMKPLGVVVNHGWFSEVGWYNLQNILETFNIDSIMLTPSTSLVARLARKSLEVCGDPGRVWLAAAIDFAECIAHKYGIFLLVAPHGFGAGAASKQAADLVPGDLSRECAGFSLVDLIGDGLSSKDLGLLEPLRSDEVTQLQQVRLGSYLPYPPHAMKQFMTDFYGWRDAAPGERPTDLMDPGNVLPGIYQGSTRFGASPSGARYICQILRLADDEFISLVEKHDPVRAAELADALAIDVSPATPYFDELLARLDPGVKKPFEVVGCRASLPKNGVHWDAPPSFHGMSVTRVLEGYRDGEMSPVDLAKLCIDRVGAMDAEIQAWEVFDPDLLLDQARACEARLRSGENCRRLEGIPLGVKDVFNTRAFPTQMGSSLWKDFKPGNDARTVFACNRAGAVIPGKTVTAEFAVHVQDKTRNPHDPGRIPGTSSSGSAAAIAAGMVPLALGTQTAGSIIRPASFCGVYGFKPSFGLIPRTGVLKTTDSLDTIGYFTLHAEDMRTMFEVLRVHGANYPFANAGLGISQQRALEPKTRRIAFVKTHTWELAAPQVRQNLEAWAKRLDVEPGYEVFEVALPDAMNRAHRVHATIYDKALSYYFQEEYKHSDDISPLMQEIIARGTATSAEEYWNALKEQESLARMMDAFLADYDALISLSTASVAPRNGVAETDDPALMWTLTHLAAMNIPAFVGDHGLPHGLQLVGRRYDDYMVLSILEDLVQRGLAPASTNPVLV